MQLLHEVDKPGSDVDEYIKSLDDILIKKLDMIQGLWGRLYKFKTSIVEEEKLSQWFYWAQ